MPVSKENEIILSLVFFSLKTHPPQAHSLLRWRFGADNIFFKNQRAKILASIPEIKNSAMDTIHDSAPIEDGSGDRKQKKPHGKIGFENLAKLIGQLWQTSPPNLVQQYKELAVKDMKRYKAEMREYNQRKEILKQTKKQETAMEMCRKLQGERGGVTSDASDDEEEQTTQRNKKQTRLSPNVIPHKKQKYSGETQEHQEVLESTGFGARSYLKRFWSSNQVDGI